MWNIFANRQRFLILLNEKSLAKNSNFLGQRQSFAVVNLKCTLFYIGNTRLKLAKNQAKAKQHPKVELLLFENYSLSSSTVTSKIQK